MLDLVVKSIHDFQSDCANLLERDYPAVHNQGMSDQHLGLAFTRRISATLQKFGHPSHYFSLESIKNQGSEHNFGITSELGTIWLISHHVLGTGTACKKNLLNDIHEWKAEYAFATQPNDLLVIVSDHWINRNKQSKELIHWWMGVLPDSLDQYRKQGITLNESESQFSHELLTHFDTAPCLLTYSHPLSRRTSTKSNVQKYVQLYAAVEC